jgi:hypothetical protein
VITGPYRPLVCSGLLRSETEFARDGQGHVVRVSPIGGVMVGDRVANVLADGDFHHGFTYSDTDCAAVAARNIELCATNTSSANTYDVRGALSRERVGVQRRPSRW